jgi:hypothetical protein
MQGKLLLLIVVYSNPTINLACSYSDAATFHRDVVAQREWQPYMTCLTYLDETVMQVIPKSHRQKDMTWRETQAAFARRKELQVRPGDILLFYSSLLHRGIFTQGSATSRRRLIQLFDCARDKPALERLGPLLLRVPSHQQALSETMIKISKIKWLISILNMFGVVNAARGYGDWVPPAPYPPNISSEGMQGRITVVPNTWQPSNQYVLLLPYGVDLPADLFSTFIFASYTRQYIMYGMAAIVALAGLVSLLLMLIFGVVILVNLFRV